jgi:hypothetical protein
MQGRFDPQKSVQRWSQVKFHHSLAISLITRNMRSIKKLFTRFGPFYNQGTLVKTFGCNALHYKYNHSWGTTIRTMKYTRMSYVLSLKAKSCFEMWNNERMPCMFSHSTKKCCKIWKQLIKQILAVLLNHKGTRDYKTFLEWHSFIWSAKVLVKTF